MLELGTTAPDLEIHAHSGFKGPLSHFWEHGPLVLFFYPKDDTHICTKEACMLQSQMGLFGEFGAQVVGSSTDSIASHQRFAEKHQLQFPLIDDQKGKLARQYQVFRKIFRISKRVSYVIGQTGKIEGRVHHEFSLQPHLDMIQETLERIKS